MPPPILNDSEDEDDDVLYDDSNDNSLSRSSGEPAPAIPSVDGTRDTHQSTGSTERLKNQINDAQRILCGDSSEHPRLNDSHTAQAASPTLRGNKRRHSLINSETTDITQKKTLPRSKTLTTYSTKKPSSSNRERDQFLARFGQDAVVPNTSTPVRFSDHSGLPSSGALPAGSIQDEFINHEPAMFRESGSTVPDNESSHERMLEQALRSRHSNDTSSPGRIKLLESAEITKSSSFPWSASEATESAKSHRVQDVPGTADMPNVDADLNVSSQHAVGQEDTRHELGSTVPDSNEPSGLGLASAGVDISNHRSLAQQSSPTVEIGIGQAKAPALPDPVSDLATQKSGSGRKRKVQEESSEPLNSDDIAVGLPKERYKPRPSRRRATHVAEDPIDYSVVLEKAARSKRAKSAGSGLATAHDQSVMSTAHPVVSTERKPEDSAATASSGPCDHNEDTIKYTAPQKPSPVVELPGTVSSQLQEVTSARVNASASQNSRKSQGDDAVFVKPEPKTKSASKSKRSSTTIFEDHVDYTGKQQSPNLSQQQTIRKSAIALEHVENEATPAKARRGRNVVVTDDDEDELAHDPAPPEEPIKKRGRGRPPKSTSKANAKPSEKSIDEGLAGGDGDQTTTEEPPKKRRGRPPKSASTIPKVDDNAAAIFKADSENQEPNEEMEAEAGDEESAKTSIEAPEKEITPTAPTSLNIPTPSPEKQAPAKDNTASTSKPTKTSPTTHSPIKSSSPAPYRVGLSKKHRIPSLLRVMRPPPPKRG
ncbi:hypothetical protein Q7P37_007054 [Cladosporium fusiforme]